MEITDKRLHDIISAPLWIFAISFILGTMLMLLYLINEDEGLMIIGFLYVLTALIINLVALLVMIALSYIHRQHQMLILRNTAILLVNIPVAILYAFILFN